MNQLVFNCEKTDCLHFHHFFQANALKDALETKNVTVNVYVGMRYWYPFTEEAVEQVSDCQFPKIYSSKLHFLITPCFKVIFTPTQLFFSKFNLI